MSAVADEATDRANAIFLITDAALHVACDVVHSRVVAEKHTTRFVEIVYALIDLLALLSLAGAPAHNQQTHNHISHESLISMLAFARHTAYVKRRRN